GIELMSEPYLEKPDEHVPEGTEKYCFIDSNRPCTAECMAFLVVRPEGPDYEGQQWAACSLLVNMHRGGKHLTVLASQGAAVLKDMRIKMADEKRLNQPPPPRGG